MFGSHFFVDVLDAIKTAQRHQVPHWAFDSSALALRSELKSALRAVFNRKRTAERRRCAHIALSTTGSVFMIRFASVEPKTNRMVSARRRAG
jgi:uncharacterized protein (DUF2384 family)